MQDAGKEAQRAGSPQVSVVMTTYRTAHVLLRRAVESILGQTLADLELILVFEPGDDGHRALCAEISDPRLVVLVSAEKMGFTRSLNIGLRRARAHLVARMDSDDWSHPERLARQAAFLDAHPGIALVGTQVRVVDAAGTMIGVRRAPANHADIVAQFTFANAMHHPTVMWDRARIGWDTLYNERFASAEDLEMWLRLIEAGHRLANLDDLLLDYTIAGDMVRPLHNWRNNMRSRLLHWRLGLRHPKYLLGLAALSILALLPKRVIDMLTARGPISDRIRAIEKHGPENQGL